MNNPYNLYNLEAKNQNKTPVFHSSINESVKSDCYSPSSLSRVNCIALSISSLPFSLSYLPLLEIPLTTQKESVKIYSHFVRQNDSLKQNRTNKFIRLRNNSLRPVRKEGDIYENS